MRITILAHPEAGGGDTFGDGVGQVAMGLRKGQHRVSILGVHNEIGKLISGLKRRQPDLVFNLIGQNPRDGPPAAAVVGLLDLLGVPYTGCCPGEFYIHADRALVRLLLEGSAADGYDGEESGAIASVDRRGRPARRFRVGLIGNDELITFGPIEVDSGPAKAPFDEVGNVCDHLLSAARSAYQTLRVRDYGFVDLSVSDDDAVTPTGVQGNCDLSHDGQFARSAAAAGIDYVALVNRIADYAIARAAERPPVRLI